MTWWTAPSHDRDRRGNGPIAAFAAALAPLGWDVRVLDYAEHALRPAATPGRRPTSSARSATGCSGASGIDENIVTASLHAVLNAVARVARCAGTVRFGHGRSGPG